MQHTVLITGGARGIGFGIADFFATAGYKVAICDIGTAEDNADTVKKLRDSGAADVLYCQCDVADTAAHKVMMANIIEAFGSLNVLVNNAGVGTQVRGDLFDATEESFDFVLGINLRGPYFLTQTVAKHMIEQKNADTEFDACVINISSISSTVASPSRGDYCISKAGVSMATKLWAVRLGEYNIQVYEVWPGVIKTDMTAAVTGKYDKLIDEGLCLTKRWGYPEDIAKAVLMLANGTLAYSTGQVIKIDGGMLVDRL
ncbi:MAG: 3-ketoacyl-ACP reductase [Victivallaceae bacterium]|nr:3-ketoacyl-ACP reductase [Victivallaceae bacterium]